MTNDELMAELSQEPTYLLLQDKGDAGVCAVVRLAFHWMIIAECSPTGYGDRWCYSTFDKAMDAFSAWDGADGTEPTGWHRHPSSGRRINPDTGETYIHF